MEIPKIGVEEYVARQEVRRLGIGPTADRLVWVMTGPEFVGEKRTLEDDPREFFAALIEAETDYRVVEWHRMPEGEAFVPDLIELRYTVSWHISDWPGSPALVEVISVEAARFYANQLERDQSIRIGAQGSRFMIVPRERVIAMLVEELRVPVTRHA